MTYETQAEDAQREAVERALLAAFTVALQSPVHAPAVFAPRRRAFGLEHGRASLVYEVLADALEYETQGMELAMQILVDVAAGADCQGRARALLDGSAAAWASRNAEELA